MDRNQLSIATELNEPEEKVNDFDIGLLPGSIEIRERIGWPSRQVDVDPVEVAKVKDLCYETLKSLDHLSRNFLKRNII